MITELSTAQARASDLSAALARSEEQHSETADKRYAAEEALRAAEARASAAETALARAEKERDEMMNRAASLALHLPPETLVGDVRRWRDEFKSQAATTQAELRAALERVKALEAYQAYLLEADKMTAGFLYCHNWRYPDELIKRGEVLREAIRAAASAPPLTEPK